MDAGECDPKATVEPEATVPKPQVAGQRQERVFGKPRHIAHYQSSQ